MLTEFMRSSEYQTSKFRHLLTRVIAHCSPLKKNTGFRYTVCGCNAGSLKLSESVEYDVFALEKYHLLRRYTIGGSDFMAGTNIIHIV